MDVSDVCECFQVINTFLEGYIMKLNIFFDDYFTLKSLHTIVATWTCVILETERAACLMICLGAASVPSASPTRVSRDGHNNICWSQLQDMKAVSQV